MTNEDFGLLVSQSMPLFGRGVISSKNNFGATDESIGQAGITGFS